MTIDYVALATEGVRGLRPYQPGKPIEELRRQYGLNDIIKLASNENPLGPGLAAKEAIERALKNVTRYPDGNGFELKSVLSEQLTVSMNQITLGNGSNDILELLVRGYACSGDTVVFSQHAFAVYALATQVVGAHPIVVPASSYGHDLEAMEHAITETTKVLFVANPNNPTGTWSNKTGLLSLLENVPEHVLVVVDEAYREYVDDSEYPDASKWLDDFPNLVVVRTFSKVYGLAGLRVGYCISGADIADVLNRARQPFNVNSIGMSAAAAALTDAEHIKLSVNLNKSGLKRLTNSFARLGLPFIPSVGNFVSFDVGPNAALVNENLLRQGVIVRPIQEYGMKQHLRVTVGLEQENERFILALEKALSDVYSS